jgi:hypothetical protein
MKNRPETVRTSYKHYKNNSGELSAISYREIVYAFISFLVIELFSGKLLKLPFTLGHMRIIGKKQKPKLNEKGEIINQFPNWKETKNLWESCPPCKDDKQIVFHLNEHTNNIRYKFKWIKKGVTGIYFYTFIPCRTNKRLLAKTIKAGTEYHVEPTKVNK